MSRTKTLIAVVAAAFAVTLAASLVAANSAQAWPYSHHMTCSVDNSSPPEGGTVTIHCTGAHPDVTLTIFLHPKNYFLGTATTDDSGNATTTVSLPTGETGHHVLLIRQPRGNSVPIPIDIGGVATAGFSVKNPTGDSASATGGATLVGVAALGLALLLGGGLTFLAGRRRRDPA